jgi:hypothetical protein
MISDDRFTSYIHKNIDQTPGYTISNKENYKLNTARPMTGQINKSNFSTNEFNSLISRLPRLTSPIGDKRTFSSRMQKKGLDKEAIIKQLSKDREREVYPRCRPSSCIYYNEEQKEPTSFRRVLSPSNSVYNGSMISFPQKIIDNETVTQNTKLPSSPTTDRRFQKKVTISRKTFLFSNFNDKYGKEYNISNPKVKKIHKENPLGPYFTHCTPCNRKNLEFYDKMRPDTAISILKTIKQLDAGKSK